MRTSNLLSTRNVGMDEIVPAFVGADFCWERQARWRLVSVLVGKSHGATGAKQNGPHSDQ